MKEESIHQPPEIQKKLSFNDELTEHKKFKKSSKIHKNRNNEVVGKNISE
jgi:hypothetical protein